MPCYYLVTLFIVVDDAYFFHELRVSSYSHIYFLLRVDEKLSFCLPIVGGIPTLSKNLFRAVYEIVLNYLYLLLNEGLACLVLITFPYQVKRLYGGHFLRKLDVYYVYEHICSLFYL